MNRHGGSSGLFAAADVHYLPSGGARPAAVLAADATFSAVLTEQTALVRQVLPYRPGEFFRRMAGPFRLPDALRRADALARTGLADE